MDGVSLSPPGWVRKSGVFVLFFFLESMIFAIITLSPYLARNTLLSFHACLTAILLIVALFLRRSDRAQQY